MQLLTHFSPIFERKSIFFIAFDLGYSAKFLARGNQYLYKDIRNYHDVEIF
jgi:hypothetical protein